MDPRDEPIGRGWLAFWWVSLLRTYICKRSKAQCLRTNYSSPSLLRLLSLPSAFDGNHRMMNGVAAAKAIKTTQASSPPKM